MSKRALMFVIIPIIAIVTSAADAAETDWWGHKLPNIPSQFIFGYGSLINTQSRNSTSNAPILAIPVRVSSAFGYIRTWNDRSPTGFTALGLRKARADEKATTINGVLYPVEGEDMTKFDAREDGYVRVEVSHANIEPVSWQAIPQEGHIWTYVPARPGSDPGVGLPEPDAAFPLLESYIDVVIEGGLEYGPEFARELIETTADWSQFWLNDRELARRPWVHDNQYAIVDKMLNSIPPAATQFKNRLFVVQYAVRWGSTLQ